MRIQCRTAAGCQISGLIGRDAPECPMGGWIDERAVKDADITECRFGHDKRPSLAWQLGPRHSAAVCSALKRGTDAFHAVKDPNKC